MKREKLKLIKLNRTVLKYETNNKIQNNKIQNNKQKNSFEIDFNIKKHS